MKEKMQCGSQIDQLAGYVSCRVRDMKAWTWRPCVDVERSKSVQEIKSTGLGDGLDKEHEEDIKHELLVF